MSLDDMEHPIGSFLMRLDNLELNFTDLEIGRVLKDASHLDSTGQVAQGWHHQRCARGPISLARSEQITGRRTKPQDTELESFSQKLVEQKNKIP